MTNVTCRLTAKNRHQLRNPTCGLSLPFYVEDCGALHAAKCPIQNPFPSPHPASNKAKFGGVNSMSGESVKSWLNIWLTAKNGHQLRNSTLGNRVWATVTFLGEGLWGGRSMRLNAPSKILSRVHIRQVIKHNPVV